LIARIRKHMIIVQEVMSYWDIKQILDDMKEILLKREYKPTYFFEGTPIIGQGGFSVIIKLERELSEADKKVLEKILRYRGFKIVYEDEA